MHAKFTRLSVWQLVWHHTDLPIRRHRRPRVSPALFRRLLRQLQQILLLRLLQQNLLLRLFPHRLPRPSLPIPQPHVRRLPMSG